MGRKRLYDERLRRRLLEAAGRRVSRQGVEALSLRTLAADAGTSTAAVYALFGGKGGLLSALHEQAFRRLAAHQSAVRPTGDPVEDVVQLGLAYRDAALADPHGYRVMFGDYARVAPDLAVATRAAETFLPLLTAVRRGVEEGRLRNDVPPESIATALWANVHGLVSLELGEFMPPYAGDPADVFGTAVRATIRGWEQRPPVRPVSSS